MDSFKNQIRVVAVCRGYIESFINIRDEKARIAEKHALAQGRLWPFRPGGAALQLQAHERVREATRDHAKVRIEPVLPVDILGAYLLLPVL
jgi:hypothetical protein